MSSSKNYGWICFFLCAALIAGALAVSRVSTAIAVSGSSQRDATVVIDAGHGGEDGGAISVTGVHESSINLQIALRLNDLLHLLGRRTVMIRATDVSVYTEGTTIAQKKVSDIRNRVRAVEAVDNALLVSIHQNQFQESKYRGAQVFYAKTAGSQALAEQLQEQLSVQLDPNNHRQCKKSNGVYLMEHISCPAVLVECGFLSNAVEEALLRDEAYQKKLAAVIACTVNSYSEDNHEV